MEHPKSYTSRYRSFVVFFVGLLVVINILGITGFRGLKPKVVDKSEYSTWRGKSRIDDNDMVEIANWVDFLGGRMADALKFYWVENEVYYPYAAVVRGMYAVFNETYRAKGFSPTFLGGMEVIIHYCLLKTAFVLSRFGGVRGNNTDAASLKAAVKPLQTCYATVSKKNFTAEVFPISRKKRMIRFPHTARRRRNRSVGLSHGRILHRKARSITKFDNETRSTTTESPEHSASVRSSLEGVEDNNTLQSNSSQGQQGRYMYTLNYGVKQSVQKTIIDVADDDDNRMENIAVSIFWLIYQVLPSTCKWAPAQQLAYKTAFDGILGLVLSLYLYDQDDFLEEYERIFKIPRRQFDAEWVKIELIAKQVQRDSKIVIPRPYSNTP